MRSQKWAILAPIFLAGCATNSGNFCIVAEPIRPSVHDTLTDGTVRQILAHDEAGAKLCGWTK